MEPRFSAIVEVLRVLVAATNSKLPNDRIDHLDHLRRDPVRWLIAHPPLPQPLHCPGNVPEQGVHQLPGEEVFHSHHVVPLFDGRIHQAARLSLGPVVDGVPLLPFLGLSGRGAVPQRA